MPFGELDFEKIAAPAISSWPPTGHHRASMPPFPGSLDAGAAQRYPDFGVPWQVQTRLIGRALGGEELAEQQWPRWRPDRAAGGASRS